MGQVGVHNTKQTITAAAKRLERPISIGFGDVMVPGVDKSFQACSERGMPMCSDNNAGNPIGVGLAQFNVGGGERSYAANAFLGEHERERLGNLTIISRTSCDRLCFEVRRAVGVDLYLHETGNKF
jgi:choline dehydrogenase-like flavoprotein